MKHYKEFVNECRSANISEESLAFSYNDGGEEMTVVISGSKGELRKIKKNLPAGTKLINNVPEDAMKIKASEWEQLQ